MSKVLCLILFLGGCAGFDLSGSGASLAVQFSTGKYIEAGPTPSLRAQSVIDEVNKARSFFDFESISVSEIKEKMKERIESKGLSLSDVLLANALIDSVQIKIDEDIELGKISADDRIKLNKVLDLIESTAKLYL